ncbi:MAG: hypothetical protein AAGJ82_10645, partial [Bacteroidota bacterium]
MTTKYLFVCCVLLLNFHLTAWGQSTSLGPISSIHPIEAAQQHYADLQTLDAAPSSELKTLDTLQFLPERYNNYALAMATGQPHYLTADQVSYLKKSVQYPANSSDQTQAELDFLLQLQAKRTPEQVERVMFLAKIGYWPVASALPDHPRNAQNLTSLFFEVQEVMGAAHTAERYPFTTKLLQGIMVDMRIMEFAVKYERLRARPYNLQPKIEPLQVMGSPSFASGHTLWAYIQAYTWAELLP